MPQGDEKCTKVGLNRKITTIFIQKPYLEDGTYEDGTYEGGTYEGGTYEGGAYEGGAYVPPSCLVMNLMRAKFDVIVSDTFICQTNDNYL